MPPKGYKTSARPISRNRAITKRKKSALPVQSKPCPLSLKQVEALHEAAQPLMLWMKQNGHPHISAIVTSERCDVVETLATVMRD